MQEPFVIETYLNNEFQNRVVIETGKSNIGIVSSLFDIPSSDNTAALSTPAEKTGATRAN